MSLEELKELRFKMVEDVRGKWEAGRIDQVITRLSTAAKDFEEMGIPCTLYIRHSLHAGCDKAAPHDP
mgnify:CR=1 FL=1